MIIIDEVIATVVEDKEAQPSTSADPPRRKPKAEASRRVATELSRKTRNARRLATS